MKKNIPNIITLLNLFCGCLAIRFINEWQMDKAAYLILAALILDYFDGMAARLLHVHSELGKQLDSLADVVSFGVVPGFVVFQLMKHGIQLSYPDWDKYQLTFLLKASPFIISMFSALRLAKFNLDTRQSTSFIGLPTPANTLFFMSLPLIMIHGNIALIPYIVNPFLLLFLTLLFSYLLIAEIPLFALKFKNLSFKDNSIQYIFLAISAILIPIFLYTAIPMIIILYVILSLINNLNKK